MEPLLSIISIGIRINVLALSTLLLLAVGCTGTESQESTPPVGDACAAVTPARADGDGSEGRRVTLTAEDDFFAPSCLSIEGGGDVTIVVRNAGSHPHNLTLADGSSVAVDAGQAGFLQASLSTETVSFECTIHPGMRGEFQVTTR